MNLWLHRFAILVAVLALMLVATGALVSNARSTGGADLEELVSQHRMLSYAAALLVAIEVIWMMFAAPKWRGLASLIVLAVAAEAYSGQRALADPKHSTFGHVNFAWYFCVLAAIAALVTAPLWDRETIRFPKISRPSWRWFALFAATLVLLAALGSGFRYKLLGVMPNTLGALLLPLFLCGVAVLVLRQPKETVPAGNPLRVLAIILLIAAGLQLVWGLAVISLGTRSALANSVMIVTVLDATNTNLVLEVAMLVAVIKWWPQENPSNCALHS